jgi:hypothetical protein
MPFIHIFVNLYVSLLSMYYQTSVMAAVKLSSFLIFGSAWLLYALVSFVLLSLSRKDLLLGTEKALLLAWKR